MPIEYTITKYKCKFRCGFSNRSQGIVEEHEARCWKDPEKRSCVSCKHNRFDLRYQPTEFEYARPYRECMEGHDVPEEDEQGNMPPALNCPFWEAYR